MVPDIPCGVKPLIAPSGESTCTVPSAVIQVAFHPGAEKSFRHMVFNLARFSALAAADTLKSIDDETI